MNICGDQKRLSRLRDYVSILMCESMCTSSVSSGISFRCCPSPLNWRLTVTLILLDFLIFLNNLEERVLNVLRSIDERACV